MHVTYCNAHIGSALPYFVVAMNVLVLSFFKVHMLARMFDDTHTILLIILDLYGF